MEKINNIRVLRFKQNKNEFISAIFPFELISNLSEVIEYGTHPDGYQRKPNRAHFLKVKSYIKEHENDFKFPSSIILGVDESKFIRENLKCDNCGEYISLNSNQTDKVFRIVDGQHRIEGLKLAMLENDSIRGFLLPVLIILTKKENKSTELEIFTQINSTAKRISTDLAVLAKYNYQIKEKTVNEKDVVMYVSMKSAYNIKEKAVDSVWHSGIKFDIHSEMNIGIVGVTLFCESIKGIVDGFIDKSVIKNFIASNDRNGLINYCHKQADKITILIDDTWNKVIRNKWPSCFTKSIVRNENEEVVDVFYSKNYYIQNTLGVKVLNNILGEIIKSNGNGSSSFNEFERIIRNSKVTSNDWSKGGPFSGLSSEAGFGKIRKMIKNEIPVSKN